MGLDNTERHGLETGTKPGSPHLLSHYYSTHEHNVRKPFGFFHPTRVELIPSAEDNTQSGSSRWNSRASRKNRFTPDTVHVQHHDETGEKPSSKTVVVEQRLRHPNSKLKVHLTWDISFWVAVVFVVGSATWVVNGFILFLPLLDIGGDHPDAAAWWAFAGGTIFEIGSYLMLVESLNTGHDELFGPALWGLVSRSNSHLNDSGEAFDEKKRTDVKYRWIGLGSPRDLGYLACSIQMAAATIFWISTITGLPGVIPNLATSPPVAITDVFFWTPQVVGGCGFIIASLLLMVEVQKKWWLPNLTSMGWHIGFWNLVGAFGFMLCGALGYASLVSTKVGYESVLATFWGSWAFQIGGVIQLWETLWREVPEDNESGHQ